MGMVVAAEGLTLRLPDRWEAVIERGRLPDAEAVVARRLATGRAPTVPPVAHLANFALPSDRGDFGSGAVESMGEGHALVALVEFGPTELGSPLFADPLPRRLAPADFHPRALQRTIAGQCGTQHFGHLGGRPFSLYVVLGRDRAIAPLVGAVNEAVAGIEVAHR